MKTFKWFGLISVMSLTFVLLGLAGNKKEPQRCTRIKIPETTNMPVIVQGKRTLPPTSISPVFKPVFNLVELPEGYRAVGGGDRYVIACTP